MQEEDPAAFSSATAMAIVRAKSEACTGAAAEGGRAQESAPPRKICIQGQSDASRERITTPVDRLLLAFIFLLAIVTAAWVPAPALPLASLAAMALSIVGLARVRGRSPVLGIAHAFVALPVLAGLVNAVGPAIESVNPARYDAALSSLDARLFGPLVAHWTYALGRPDWLTDAAAIAYLSYYVLPVAFAAALWRSGRHAEFERLVYSLSAVLLVSYAAYFVAPASGPRFSSLASAGGGVPATALRAFLHVCERNELDAFPSGHTATSLVFLAEAWALFPRRRALLLLSVAAIVFSTVYLSLHYVIDVVAGAALAGVVLFALRRRAAALINGGRWAPLSAS